MTTWAEINEGDVVLGGDSKQWAVEGVTRGKALKVKIRRLKDGKEYAFEPAPSKDVTRISEGAPKIKGIDPTDLAVAVVSARAPGSEVLSDEKPGDLVPSVPAKFRTPGAYLAHLYAFHGIKDPKLDDPRHVHEGGEGYHDHIHEEIN